MAQGDLARGDPAKPRGVRAPLLIAAALAVVVAALIAAVTVVDLSGGAGTDSGASVLRWGNDPGAVYDRPVVTLRPTPKTSPSPTPVAPPAVAPFRDTPFRMVIESIGVDAPVVAYGLDSDAVPQVPLNAYDVAWYNFSAQPGTGGNAVFAGHVTWSGQAVFYALNTLVAGDTIRLRGDDGAELLYTVSESFMVDPNDPSALALMGPAASDTVTIITCDGSFYYTGDPVFRGDYTNRRVVRAALTSMNLVSAAQSSSGG